LEGVDLTIQAAGPRRPRIDIQLKATINLGEAKDGVFQFPLKRRNYDLLRELTVTPRILVVVDLPKLESDWLSVTSDQLVMRRCAYWLSLAGASESNNNTSITVSIPVAKRFDIEGLQALMEQARTGYIT
jgi:Domain of unknown function (DUF4365)